MFSISISADSVELGSRTILRGWCFPAWNIAYCADEWLSSESIIPTLRSAGNTAGAKFTPQASPNISTLAGYNSSSSIPRSLARAPHQNDIRRAGVSESITSLRTRAAPSPSHNLMKFSLEYPYSFVFTKTQNLASSQVVPTSPVHRRKMRFSRTPEKGMCRNTLEASMPSERRLIPLA